MSLEKAKVKKRNYFLCFKRISNDSFIFQAILILKYPEYFSKEFSQILCTGTRFSKLCQYNMLLTKLCFAGVHPVSASHPKTSLSYFPVNHQCDGCLVPLTWMLMAGLQGFASNDKILLIQMLISTVLIWNVIIISKNCKVCSSSEVAIANK